MRKLIVIFLLLPLFASGQIIYDNFESESFDAGWSESTGNGTVTVIEDSSIDSCWLYEADIDLTGSGSAWAMITESWTAADVQLLTFRCFFYINDASTVGSYAADDYIVSLRSSTTNVFRIHLYDSTNLYFQFSYLGTTRIGDPIEVSTSTVYEVKIKVHNWEMASENDTAWCYFDEVQQGDPYIRSWIDGEIDNIRVGPVIDNTADADMTLYYDNVGLWLSDPGDMGTPDACPGTIIYDNIESGSQNGDWGSTGNLDVGTDYALDSCYGVRSVVSGSGNDWYGDYDEMTWSAEDDVIYWLRFYFKVTDTTGLNNHNWSTALSMRTSTSEYVCQLEVFSDGGILYANGLGLTYQIGTPQAITLGTTYSAMFKYICNDGATRDTVRWWLDGVAQGITSSGIDRGDPNNLRVGWIANISNGGDIDGTIYFDNIGVHVGDSVAPYGNPDACPSGGLSHKINGVEWGSAAKAKGVDRSSIGKIIGVDWQ